MAWASCHSLQGIHWPNFWGRRALGAENAADEPLDAKTDAENAIEVETDAENATEVETDAENAKEVEPDAAIATDARTVSSVIRCNCCRCSHFNFCII